MIVGLILTVISIGFLVAFLWKHKQTIYIAWNIPGPFWVLPFIGNALMFRDSSKIVETLEWMSNTFGSPCRLWLGPQLLLLYNDPEDLKTIMTSTSAIDKGMAYEHIRSIIGGHGLLTSGGEEWKIHRKCINPTIQHSAVLNSFYPIFNLHMRTLVEKVGNHVGQGEFNFYLPMEACALDMICETTFGVRINVQQNQNLDVLHAANNLLNVISAMIFQPWLRFKPVFWLSKYAKTFDDDLHCVRTFAKDIIGKKIDEYKRSLTESPQSTDSTDTLNISSCKRNFVDECMKLLFVDKIFTIDDVINESITMLAGGFETNAITGSYVILMLAIHQDMQDTMFNEIHDIFPDQSSDPTGEDLAKLDFTNRFIQETLRVTPSLPFATRSVVTDMQIGNHLVPKGTELVLDFMNTHHCKKIWGPNAKIFNPDNFLSENVHNRHPFSFLPFSGGIRNCIGFKYAYIALRLFIIWLVRHYRFTTSLKMEDLKFQMSISLKLQNKHMIEVHRRLKY